MRGVLAGRVLSPFLLCGGLAAAAAAADSGPLRGHNGPSETPWRGLNPIFPDHRKPNQQSTHVGTVMCLHSAP
jgi:hypothetical protein